jgi:hypothetical protein
MTGNGIITTARNADWQDVLKVLQDQRARAHDIIVPGERIRYAGGNLVVTGDSLDEETMEPTDGTYRPMQIMDEGMAARLDLPSAFMRKLREQGRLDMLDGLVNGRLAGWADGPTDEVTLDGETIRARRYPADPRKHLLRLLRGSDGEPGIGRGWLSARYRFVDSVDVMLAILQGMREAGIEAIPTTCDLSERRWYMRVEAPEFAAFAPNLLRGYRSQFGEGGRQRAGADALGVQMASSQSGLWEEGLDRATGALGIGRDDPQVGDIVWAGMVATNSDNGGGARILAPQVRVLACRNGQTITKRADKVIHLGGEQSEGLVEWSAETMRTELDLIRRQTVDATKQFLSQGWLDEQVADIEALAGARVSDPDLTIKEVAKAAGFSQGQADDILAFYREGGQRTAGGVANAATAYAQTVDSPDVAYDLEKAALPMMEHAARVGPRDVTAAPRRRRSGR